MRSHRVLITVALVLLILLGTVAVLAAQGGVRTWGGATRLTSLRQVAHAPSWTAPCWKRALVDSRPLVAACAQVTGRVILRNGPDPHDKGDVELLLLVDFGLIGAKIQGMDVHGPLPGWGSMVTVTGPMVDDGNGLHLIYAWAIR